MNEEGGTMAGPTVINWFRVSYGWHGLWQRNKKSVAKDLLVSGTAWDMLKLL